MDYFFRGELEVKFSGANLDTLEITNKGSEAIAGRVTLYYDNEGGEREPVDQGSWELSLALGGTSPSLSFNLPQDAKEEGKYILVFQGTMGSEEGAVIGKVIEAKAVFKIPFISKRDGNYEVYVMDMDGSNQINLSNNPEEDVYLALSPDGTRVVFSTLQYTPNFWGTYHLVAINTDGSNRVELTDNPLYFNLYPTYAHAYPTYSPDGQKIAFTAWDDYFSYSNPFIMDSDGANKTRLTDKEYWWMPGNVFNPRFSPDGSKIVYCSYEYSEEEQGLVEQILIIDSDGSNKINLSNFAGGQDYLPQFSPDGSKILFASYRADRNDEIYVMNTNGSNRVNLSNNPADDYDHQFSPDGSKIVFTSHREGKTEVYLMNADGSNPINLSNNPSADELPYFSPDGKKIIFNSYRDGNGEIYMMNIDGTEQTNLTNNPAGDYLPAAFN